MHWAGKTAIVTGGAVRLGREIALALAEDGMHVAVHFHRSERAAHETVERIRSLGVRSAAVPADLRHPAAAASQVIERAAQQLGSIGVLVNSAAVFEPGSLAETTEEQWDRHFSINLKAPAFLCREFAKHLAGDRPGHILNITDWRASRPQPGHLAYTLTKSALVTLTQILAQELAPRIQVNALALGAILPPPGAEADHMQRLAQTIPLRRTGCPADVTDAVRFLLRSDFITGEVLCVTGGEQL